MANLLKSEGPLDNVILKLCEWMDLHADEKKPMDLVRSLQCISDVVILDSPNNPSRHGNANAGQPSFNTTCLTQPSFLIVLSC
jgi:hypothetical protein